MLKVEVGGQREQVQPFLSELEQYSQIELKNKTIVEEEQGEEEIRVICHVEHHPERRMKMVILSTAGGGEIRLPLLDLLLAEMDEGKTIIAGRSFDIFGN